MISAQKNKHTHTGASMPAWHVPVSSTPVSSTLIWLTNYISEYSVFIYQLCNLFICHRNSQTLQHKGSPLYFVLYLQGTGVNKSHACSGGPAIISRHVFDTSLFYLAQQRQLDFYVSL